MITNKIKFKHAHLGKTYYIHITKPKDYEVTIHVATWLFNNELAKPGFSHRMHGLNDYEKGKVRDIVVTDIQEIEAAPPSIFKRF